MKFNAASTALLALSFALSMAACSSNPNKAEKIDTAVNSTEDVGGGRTLGLNQKDEMVTQRKIKMSDYLKQLQYDVYGLEKEIFGDESVGVKGKWGVLEDCRMQANSVQLGGEGTYVNMPDKTILTKNEDRLQRMGLDENKNLVGISEDYLKDRTQRFESYKDTYQARKDWYDLQIKICKAAVQKKQDEGKATSFTSPAPYPAQVKPSATPAAQESN